MSSTAQLTQGETLTIIVFLLLICFILFLLFMRAVYKLANHNTSSQSKLTGNSPRKSLTSNGNEIDDDGFWLMFYEEEVRDKDRN